MSEDCAVLFGVDLAEASLLVVLQVQVTDDDIRLQGESLHDTLSRYFVAPEMKLMPQSFWEDALEWFPDEAEGNSFITLLQTSLTVCKHTLSHLPRELLV